MIPAPAEAKTVKKAVFQWVAQNLYRLETSGSYYGFVKRGDKQFRRSLKTTDRKVAAVRLGEFRAEIGNLNRDGGWRQSFDEVARRWLAVTRHALKPQSAARRELCVRAVAPFFQDIAIRNIRPEQNKPIVLSSGEWLVPVHLLQHRHGIGPFAERTLFPELDPSKHLRLHGSTQATMRPFESR